MLYNPFETPTDALRAIAEHSKSHGCLKNPLGIHAIAAQSPQREVGNSTRSKLQFHNRPKSSPAISELVTRHAPHSNSILVRNLCLHVL